MAFFKKIYNDLFSDNDIICEFLKTPVDLPEAPSLGSMELPPNVKRMLEFHPEIAHAIAASPGLVDRLCRNPYLVRPLVTALDQIENSYRRAIEETNKVIRTRIEQNESLRVNKCERTWLKEYRATQYNDVFQRHDKMKSLLANSENDLTAGSEFKKQHPDISYDRCYYVVRDDGIGWLVLSGAPVGIEGKIDISLGENWLELTMELPETPFLRAETKTLFKSTINQNILNTLEQYRGRIGIGFMPEAPKGPNQLPRVLPLAPEGRIQGYNEGKMPCYSGAASSCPEFWIDVHANRLAWVPSEWQHMQDRYGSWVIAVVHMLSPMSGNGPTKALQHRLRDLSCKRWTRWFVHRNKRAPAPPARLDRIPGWADVELQMNRPMNEAQ
ncbi:hypothetical protein [Microvirga yunnanensis]|uniref:hypothetical protein n=1 Tax=Microvirga yunnanensis TaxID=2953740 RepID=UPI0021CAA9A8|nr:hypothetical protein [Microvirga sp. HBU65207]